MSEEQVVGLEGDDERGPREGRPYVAEAVRVAPGVIVVIVLSEGAIR